MLTLKHALWTALVALTLFIPYRASLWAAVALVDGQTANESNTSQTLTGVSYSAGNAHVVCVHYGNTPVAVTVTGSVNGAYTESGTAESDSAFATTHLFYKANLSGTTENITVAFASIRHASISLTEWSGVDTATPTGGTAAGTNTSSGDILSGSLSAAGASGDVVIGCGGNYYSSTFAAGATNPSGFAIINDATLQRTEGTGSITQGYAVLAGAYSGAVSIDPSGTTYGNIKAIVLKAGSGGGGGSAGCRLLLLGAGC